MIVKKIIRFKDGLHSRNAMLLSELAREYNGDLKIVSKNGNPININCCSMISILLGQILENDEIELETSSSEVVQRLNEILKK